MEIERTKIKVIKFSITHLIARYIIKPIVIFQYILDIGKYIQLMDLAMIKDSHWNNHFEVIEVPFTSLGMPTNSSESYFWYISCEDIMTNVLSLFF